MKDKEGTIGLLGKEAKFKHKITQLRKPGSLGDCFKP